MKLLVIALVSTFILTSDMIINHKKLPCFEPEISADHAIVESVSELHNIQKLAGSSRLLFNSSAKTYDVVSNDSIITTPMHNYSKNRCKMNDHVLCWNEVQDRKSDILNDYYNVIHVFYFNTQRHEQFNHETGHVARFKMSKFHPNMLYVMKTSKAGSSHEPHVLQARMELWNIKTEQLVNVAPLSILPRSDQSCLDNLHLVETNNPKHYLLYDRYFGAKKSWLFDFDEFKIISELPYKDVTSSKTNTEGTLIAIGYQYSHIVICQSDNLAQPIQEISLDKHIIKSPLCFVGSKYLALLTDTTSYCDTCKKSHEVDYALQIFNILDGKKVFKKFLKGRSLKVSPLTVHDSDTLSLLYREDSRDSQWSTIVFPSNLESLKRTTIYSLIRSFLPQ